MEIATRDSRNLQRILCVELRARISSIHEENDASLLYACVVLIEFSMMNYVIRCCIVQYVHELMTSDTYRLSLSLLQSFRKFYNEDLVVEFAFRSLESLVDLKRLITGNRCTSCSLAV